MTTISKNGLGQLNFFLPSILDTSNLQMWDSLIEIFNKERDKRLSEFTKVQSEEYKQDICNKLRSKEIRLMTPGILEDFFTTGLFAPDLPKVSDSKLIKLYLTKVEKDSLSVQSGVAMGLIFSVDNFLREISNTFYLIKPDLSFFSKEVKPNNNIHKILALQTGDWPLHLFYSGNFIRHYLEHLNKIEDLSFKGEKPYRQLSSFEKQKRLNRMKSFDLHNCSLDSFQDPKSKETFNHIQSILKGKEFTGETLASGQTLCHLVEILDLNDSQKLKLNLEKFVKSMQTILSKIE